MNDRIRILIAISVCVGLGVLIVTMARSIQFHKTFPPNRIDCVDPKLPYSWTRNRLPSGSELFVKNSSVQAQNKTCILFVHGNTEAVHTHPPQLQSVPCALALLEPRGFGHLYHSRLSYTGFITDAIEAYSHLKRRYNHVVAVGHSLGGSAVMAIPNAEHIVTMNTFASPHALAADQYPILQSIGAMVMNSTLRPIEHVRKRVREGCRITVYHAKHDKRILLHHGRSLADAGNVPLHVVGTNHMDIGPQINHFVHNEMSQYLHA